MTHRYLRINLSFLLVIAVFFILAAPFAHAGLCVERCYFFNNPLTSGDLGELIKSVIDQIFPLAIMILVLIIIGYGFLYVYYSSTDNQSGLKKLKENAIKLLIGAAIIAGSKVIVEAVKLFANGFK